MAAVAGTMLLMSGCSSPDLTPVPTIASTPYACDGVPLDSAELIAGEPLDASDPRSTWGADNTTFGCSLLGEHTLVQVKEMSVTMSPFGPTDERVLASMAAASEGDPLDLDAQGSGYVWGNVSAGWVCNGRTLEVSASGDPVEGRDRTADVTNLLTSMLPWACEGEDVPPASEEE